MSDKKKVKGLYRVKKYGTWKEFEVEVNIAADLETIRKAIELSTGEIPREVQTK